MTEPIGVLELRSVRGTGGGPEKTIILGAGRTSSDAFDITVCYLRDARDTVFRIDQQARSLGSRYVEIIERHSFDRRVWPQLRRLVKDRHIAIVHSHEYKTDLLAWLLARKGGVRPLATVHGWTGHSARERWLYYPADKRILACFPRLIAVSTEIRNELVRTGTRPDRVKVVLNGIDAEAFTKVPARQSAVRNGFGIPPEAIVVGGIGRLEPQKRFDVLIQAVAQLRRAMAGRDLRLIIAGDGSEHARLRGQAAALGAGEWCHLIGHRTDVIELHHAFDVFVQSSDYEGTPNAVLEAMALKTALVATDVGGTAELVRHGVDGLVVPPADVDALSFAIAQTITNPEAAARRTVSARARVETDLSFDARMRKMEGIYRELMRAPSVPDTTVAARA